MKALVKIIAPLGSDGANGNEMHIWYWKNISIWAKISQVSDVAHGPLISSQQHYMSMLWPHPWNPIVFWNLNYINNEWWQSFRLTHENRTEKFTDEFCFSEIELDPNRTFCPEVGCEAVCHVCSTSSGEHYSPIPVDCPEVCALIKSMKMTYRHQVFIS
jgi:hypothetical protein